VNDPTTKKNPWLYLGGALLTGFIVWRALALLADRIAYFTDPAYKEMTQRRSEVLTQQIPIRETALTAAFLILAAVVIVAAIAWLAIYLGGLWEKRHLVKPSPHGYPGVYKDGALTVPAAPTAPGVAAGNVLPALPDRVLIYDAVMPRDLTLPIGVRPDGRQITLPLLEAGGGLIAGNPGSGKSELLASIMVAANRLYQEGIAPVEVVVVDPKQLDFVGMPQLPNMPYPVVSSYAETIELLKELQNDVSSRKRTLQLAKARSVEHYLALGGQMSMRWVLIDEVSAFTSKVSRQQKEAFIRLAQEFNERGRAHGYTLVLATQRPHSDTISREVTGIVDWRIALMVSTAVESRMILDQPGAEQLQGRGRFIIKYGPGVMPGQAYLADLKGKFGPGFYGYAQPALLEAPARVYAPPTPGSTPPPTAKTQRGDAEAHTNRTSIDADHDGLPPAPAAFDAENFPTTARQQGYLFAKFQELGTITAVAREVYDAAGGDKWLWTKWAIAMEQQRRGLDYDPAWLNLPPRLKKKHLGG